MEVPDPRQTETPSEPKRQCWECLRRRLVCDAARPICNKCQTSGVVCPGYDDKKPLKWLAPGKVTARTRRPKPPTAGKKSPARKELPEEGKQRPIFAEKDLVKSSPSQNLVTSDVADVVQAIYYYNTFICPTWTPVQNLAPSGWICPLPLDILHYVKPSIRHCLTSSALTYRIQQLPSGNDVELQEMKTKVLHHRDIAIRDLSEAVADEKRQSTDETIVAVLLFLLIDIRQSATNWRQHFDGVTSLIDLRGGPKVYFKPLPHLKILLAYYCIVGVIGNTTCPAYDLASPSMHMEHIDSIAEIYEDGLFPTLLCPPDLFMAVIRINMLRHEAAHGYAPMESLQSRALIILEQISNFVAEDWVARIPSAGAALLLVASAYQCAVMLYCICSLQSVLILPQAAAMERAKAKYQKSLLLLLRKGLTSPQDRDSLIMCMLWPLIIAGFELRTGSFADRSFVGEHLEEMCQHLGSSLPLLGKAVLRKFWSSGKSKWDDCFDDRYAFVT